MDAGDARGYRVALIADELVNPARRGIDGLAALESAGWGAIQLPSGDYPDEVAAPLLELVAEQTEEFTRHGYTVAVIGRRAGLDEVGAPRGQRIGLQRAEHQDDRMAGDGGVAVGEVESDGGFAVGKLNGFEMQRGRFLNGGFGRCVAARREHHEQ